jgi:tRNA pseudouridine55 synthase
LSVDGFLVVDKASGITSHDVVAIARRALGTRKVGHAGTLDPMATGVLVLGFGIGTRLLQYITDGEKTYEATIVLGASTVTDDAEGEVLSTASAEKLAEISDSAIEEALAPMRGVILQRPSSVSAVKVAGERAYARVRAGEEVDLPPREVHISKLLIQDIRRVDHRIEIDIAVTCGAGTFIRAIARDCGEILGVGGHLSKLRRTKVAPFDLTSAISVADLKSGDFSRIDVEALAKLRFHVRDINEVERGELRFGRALTESGVDSVVAAIFQGKLIALLQDRESKAHPIAVFSVEA